MSNKYSAKYNTKRALIIGINKYMFANELENACNDAQAISQILKNNFGFHESNIILLLDEQATRQAIKTVFLSFSETQVENDDQIVVFFAGHGHTVAGNRGDVGYLIPYDGNTEDKSTLLRWDELINDTELISAKHIFFIMDACFSGIAITRALQQGSSRHLKSMLKRRAVQVLTAGKADEVVYDGGGPLPNNSMFTGHLIQALEGNAAPSDGIITANRVISYVCEKVSNDYHSRQSPHYGYVEGDGDLIFNLPEQFVSEDAEPVEELLIDIPFSQNTDDTQEDDIMEEVKIYLSDERNRIKLDTLVTREIKRYLSLASSEKFSLHEEYNIESIQKRLDNYNEINVNLQKIAIAIAYWGNSIHNPMLVKIISKLGDGIKHENGALSSWLNARWYPISILIYVSMIAAIEAGRYDVIRDITNIKIRNQSVDNNKFMLIVSEDNIGELDNARFFQYAINDGTNYITPKSEYVMKAIQPILDDLLFLGTSYEELFDKAEIFKSLIYADITEMGWGPPGRFSWKYSRRRRYGGENPYSNLLKEIALLQDDWEPLKAKLFSGSYEKAKNLVEAYKTNILDTASFR